MRRMAVIALAMLGLTGDTDMGVRGVSAAEAAVCRHDLYLRSGIGPVTVQHVSCHRAIRTLRGWVSRGMHGRGPTGWRCHRRRVGVEAPYLQVRCSRGHTRMRFGIGG